MGCLAEPVVAANQLSEIGLEIVKNRQIENACSKMEKKTRPHLAKSDFSAIAAH
jgi:hypothetical protein